MHVYVCAVSFFLICLVVRISHRAKLGSRSYVFLLLDLKKYGEFSLEEDVPVDASSKNPTALGLTYEMIEPMKKWRIKYNGPLLNGCHHPKLENRAAMKKSNVQIDLVYEVDTPMFW